MTPRVTEVLQPFTSYHKVPANILQKACIRGTAVHAICAAIAKGAWVTMDEIQEEYQGYIKSFELWRQAFVKRFLVVELRYSNNDYNGQLDFVVADKNDRPHLVDLKTSAKPQKTYPVQMGAYKTLLTHHNINVDSAILVYLDKDGDEPVLHTIHNLEDEQNVFTAALTCYKYFNAPSN